MREIAIKEFKCSFSNEIQSSISDLLTRLIWMLPLCNICKWEVVYSNEAS